MSHGQPNLKRIPFTPQEEDTIGGLAQWMKVSAGLIVATGLLSPISSAILLAKQLAGEELGGQLAALTTGQLVFNVVGGVLGLLVSCVLAFLLFTGGRSFQAVVDHDEADQENVADGLRKLRNYFFLKVAFVVMALLFVCTGAIALGAGAAALGAGMR